MLEATRYLTVFEFQPSFVSLLLCAQAHVTKLKSSEFYVGITGCLAATTPRSIMVCTVIQVKLQQTGGQQADT